VTRYEAIFLWGFPFLFVGMWLLVTTFLSVFSGWFDLQRRYPDPGEPSFLTLGMQSGVMGIGVNFNGVLTLSACPSGLRVSVWKVFGPFVRPFVVPWSQLRAESVDRFFQPMAKLTLGGEGTLMIGRRVWQRLSEAAVASNGQTALARVAPVETPDLIRAKVLQWGLGTVSAGGFFFIVSRLDPHAPAVPAVV